MKSPVPALSDLEEAGRRSLAIGYVNPRALMWRSYGPRIGRLLEHDRASELVEEKVEIATGRRPGGDRRSVARTSCSPRLETRGRAPEAGESSPIPSSESRTPGR